MPESDDDDDVQRLMTRLADGDRRAITPLYRALWPLVLARAGRSLDDAEAEDAAQGALLKLFAQAASFDRERSAIGWALALTDWEARTTARKRERRREHSAFVDAVDERQAPEQRVVQRDLARRLVSATAQLSGAERATLAAVLDDDGGPRDAAFRKRKQRLVERLRGWLRSEG